MFKFAFKNLLLKKTRTGLAIAGLVIALTGVIGLIGISEGIVSTVQETASLVEGLVVMQKDASLVSLVRADYEDVLWGFQEVSAVSPAIEAIILQIDGKRAAGGGGPPPSILGIDPVKEGKLRNKGIDDQFLVRGRALKGSDRGRVVVIGSRIADRFSKTIGSKIDINGVNFRVVGIYETESDIMDGTAIMHIDQAREISGIDPKYVSEFFVETRDPAQASKLGKKIEFKLDDVSAKTMSEFTEQFGNLFETINIFFTLISMVAVLVGGVGVLNTMIMSVMERYREFGILRALGWTQSNVTQLVIYEAIVLGVVGGVLGCASGWLLVWFINSLNLISLQLYASTQLLIIAFFLSVLLSVVGSIYPARLAAKLDPVEAIRFE